MTILITSIVVICLIKFITHRTKKTPVIVVSKRKISRHESLIGWCKAEDKMLAQLDSMGNKMLTFKTAKKVKSPNYMDASFKRQAQHTIKTLRYLHI